MRTRLGMAPFRSRLCFVFFLSERWYSIVRDYFSCHYRLQVIYYSQRTNRSTLKAKFHRKYLTMRPRFFVLTKPHKSNKLSLVADGEPVKPALRRTPLSKSATPTMTGRELWATPSSETSGAGRFPDLETPVVFFNTAKTIYSFLTFESGSVILYTKPSVRLTLLGNCTRANVSNCMAFFLCR